LEKLFTKVLAKKISESQTLSLESSDRTPNLKIALKSVQLSLI